MEPISRESDITKRYMLVYNDVAKYSIIDNQEVFNRRIIARCFTEHVGVKIVNALNEGDDGRHQRARPASR